MYNIVWTMKKGCFRIYQHIMKLAMKFMTYPEQQIVKNPGGINNIPNFLKFQNVNRILLVCSRSVKRQGLLDDLCSELEKQKIIYTIFEDVDPNTTTTNVENGYQVYIEKQCKGFVAIGGGSVLDCAKIIAIKVANPALTFEKMKKMSNIKNRIPYFIAVPTTAGTGSESTVAGVLTNTVKKEKYSVISFKCMPQAVVLDANLTLNLPKDFTAYTGMDALTHAVEAYIGTFGTAYTNSEALLAIKMIFENLEKVYENGADIEVREKMLIASNHAANAFTRAYTGYVHTISHALSALYNVGHGKTNAIILPYMLKYYGKSIESKLADIAIYTGLGKESDTKKVLAKLVIGKIESMNNNINIPRYVEEISLNDIDLIVSKALTEANPAYPVPKIMNHEECKHVVNELISK